MGKLQNVKKMKQSLVLFCGGTEIIVDKYVRDVGERYRILCTNCLSMIDPGYAQQKETVVNMWNKRVSK